MPTRDSIMSELKEKAREQTRNILIKHGSPEDRVIGVQVADLKIIAKTIKGQQDIACQLYETGMLEAMYLAGIVADGRQLNKKQLEAWAKGSAGIPMISEYTVPWVAVESPFARELALKWIASKTEHVAASGWCTYSGLVTITPDNQLDLEEVEGLLGKIVKELATSANRVRHTMNGFVIAVGSYVKPLSKQAKETAKKLGIVFVDMGDTACKVPSATAAIEKIESAGKLGKKRATIRC